MVTRKRQCKDFEFDILAVIELCGGLRQIIQKMTPKQLIEEGIVAEVIQKIGIDGLVASLTPEQLRELRDRIRAKFAMEAESCSKSNSKWNGTPAPSDVECTK
jgi:hypothetical protein